MPKHPKGSFVEKSVSLEGSRGTGKSSTILEVLKLLEEIPGLTISHSRLPREFDLDESTLEFIEIAKGKEESECHAVAIDLHEKWAEGMKTEELPPDEKEGLMWCKFIVDLGQLRSESTQYLLAMEKSSLMILDRDIDTTIVYDAAAIIQSNPDKYSSNASREALLEEMWGLYKRVCKDRFMPGLTLNFTTNHPDRALKRSHEYKEGQLGAYEIDEIQEANQVIADQLYEISFRIRQEVFNEQGLRVLSINTDGNNQEELAEIIMRILTKETEELPAAISNRSEIWFEEAETIDDLIKLVRESTTGSRFPSFEDAYALGMSNCVYNNATLVSLINEKGALGEAYLAEVLEDEYIGGNPVHWVALIVQEDGTERVIDISPFGEVYDHTVQGDSTIGEEGDNDCRYSKLRVENNVQLPFGLMELANRIDAAVPEQVEELVGIARFYIKRPTEVYRIFAGIRLVRLYEKFGMMGEVEAVVADMIDGGRVNIVFARELARLVGSGIIAIQEGFGGYLEGASEHILQAIEKMKTGGGDWESFAQYYGGVLNYKKLTLEIA